jgi:hypothetical protein
MSIDRFDIDLSIDQAIGRCDQSISRCDQPIGR